MKLLFSPQTLTFSFKVPEMKATEGVQKILGMGIGLKHHRVDYFPYWHRSNSILLGASAAVDGGIVKLWNYSYVDGVRIEASMGTFEPNTELKVRLIWENIACIVIEKKGKLITHSVASSEPPKTLFPIGFLLMPYFETDAPENKVIPFAPEIWDIRVNGREIKF